MKNLVRIAAWSTLCLGTLVISCLVTKDATDLTKGYKHVVLDKGLREIKIFAVDADTMRISVRDLRDCQTNNPEDVCTMTKYVVGLKGNFISRESYHFIHGSKVWSGEVRQVGNKEEYRQEAAWEVGNPIPYTFQTYADKPHDRRIEIEQERLNNVLAEINSAA